jgi:hypothetical protein
VSSDVLKECTVSIFSFTSTLKLGSSWEEAVVSVIWGRWKKFGQSQLSPIALIGQMSSIFPKITDTSASSRLRHQGEPDSIILKMGAVHSSKTSQHTSTKQHINPKEDQMHPFFFSCIFLPTDAVVKEEGYMSNIYSKEVNTMSRKVNVLLYMYIDRIFVN